MQSSIVSIAKAREGFSDLVNRAAFGGERFVVERRGKPLAALVSADEYQQIMRLLSEEGVRTTLNSIPVRVRFDGDRYFIDDDIVDLYGIGATLAEAQEDYLLAAQEAYADLSANQDRLAPYLQDQLDFLAQVMATKQEPAPMTTYRARDVDRALAGKLGFDKHDTHHRVYRLWLDGKLVVRTFMSHGERELSPYLADKMAKQMRLRPGEFADAVACPLGQEAYFQLLRQCLASD